MSQSFIDALMHFFALLLFPLPGRKVYDIKTKLEIYIDHAGISFPVEDCLKIFNTYYRRYFFEFCSTSYTDIEEVYDIQRHMILKAGQKAQENLYLQERILAIMSLLEYNKLKNDREELFASHIRELSKSLNISDKDFEEAESFIYLKTSFEPNKELVFKETDLSEELEGEWIKDNLPKQGGVNLKELRSKIEYDMRFHFFDNYYFIAFIYEGDKKLYINQTLTYPGYFYSFRRKDIIHFEGNPPISFEEIEENFGIKTHKIELSGKDLFYRHEKTNYSIKRFSFQEDSGQVIGIIGNNGVGKSTILRLISNQIDPAEGELCINGTSVIRNSYRLKPLIGYVSHTSIEFPNLTVYENLLYQAHLTLGNMKSEDVKRRVDETLENWSLTGIKSVKAGTFINHKINDFQRICLRIALEMIRNPYILLLDEPLSGLSFSDSKRLLSILKEETQKGKLVILTSQLPTSDIYNLFDKVWLIDQEGYMIFNGPPMASLSFFRNTGLLPYHYIQSKSDTVSAEDVFKVVETKKIRSDGSISDERQIAPGTWYDVWRAESSKEKFSAENDEEKPLPVYGTGLPGIEKQFLVYFLRNFKNRLPSLRFMIYNLVGVPLAGFLIAFITRLIFGDNYTLSNNQFLPLFLFLSVNLILLTSMFIGAEEIYNEKPQVRRDFSLNLSPFSYFNAKIAFIFLFSLIQSLIYSLSTNLILGVEGLFYHFIFVYFSVASFGNLLSLSLSFSFRKLNSIYILIPFFVIPNLLFSGYLLPFNDVSDEKDFNEPVPLVANFFPTRWAYETLVVEQFINNPYNAYFFDEKKELYHSRYTLEKTIPALTSELDECQKFKYVSPDEEELEKSLEILRREFYLFSSYEYIAPYENIGKLTVEDFNNNTYDETYGYLTYLRFLMENLILETETNIKEINAFLADSLEQINISEFREKHLNEAVENLVEGHYFQDTIIVHEDNLVKKGSPVYLRPKSVYGRSHFYASEKRFNNQYLSIDRFNMTVIWIMNLFLYILLLSNGLNVILNFFRN